MQQSQLSLILCCLRHFAHLNPNCSVKLKALSTCKQILLKTNISLFVLACHLHANKGYLTKTFTFLTHFQVGFFKALLTVYLCGCVKWWQLTINMHLKKITVDFQFVNILFALLGLMTPLYLNSVLLHRFTDEPRHLLCPMLIAPPQLLRFKYARN